MQKRHKNINRSGPFLRRDMDPFYSAIDTFRAPFMDRGKVPQCPETGTKFTAQKNTKQLKNRGALLMIGGTERPVQRPGRRQGARQVFRKEETPYGVASNHYRRQEKHPGRWSCTVMGRGIAYGI